MKKLSLSLCAVALFMWAPCSALQIDADAARIDFISYKMASKIRVPESGAPATFKDAKFSFAKTSGSVAEILQDASVEFDLSSIDTGKNVVRDNNVKSKFFALLTTQKVSGKILSVAGDDTSGTANASINFNGASKEVALKYEIKGDKLVAMGQIDLQSDFDAKEAFDKFAADKVIQGLHGKKTWPQIEVGFEVPVK